MIYELPTETETQEDPFNKALFFLHELILSFPDIEKMHWTSAMWGAIFKIYHEYHVSYDIFCQQMECIKECYKKMSNEQL